jgi:hypothetical protein
LQINNRQLFVTYVLPTRFYLYKAIIRKV